MLNRPANVYRERDRVDVPGERPWQVDARPGARLVWLFVLLCIPPVCVVGRLIQLQNRLAGAIIARTEQTTETLEPIAARDGRILGADGRVLARDAGRFEVLINYRWVEEPADPTWLRRQALARLGRTERTDSARIAAAERAILAERAAMWQRLARLTDRAPADLAARRLAIRNRVERMFERVATRRDERRTERRQQATLADADAPLWQKAWRAVVTTLTTAPERDDVDPLVLPEQSANHLLLDDLTLETAARIEAHPEQFPGLSTRVHSRREYPEGSLAAHIVGLRRPITEDDLADRLDRFRSRDPLADRPGDSRGRMGVERSYDRYLRGVRGLRRTVRNARGEVVSTEIVRPPRPGDDVMLTLELELQERLEKLLDGALAERLSVGDLVSSANGRAESPSYGAAAGGCIVAIDVRTGAVLAAASAPRFDLRVAAEPDAQTWRAILDDPLRPLFHRAVAMTLPPGSTFKTLTAVAVLESGRIDPDEKLFCQGYLDRPDRNRCYIFRHLGHGHGETDLNDALARSCNVYFFQAARTIGPEPIIEWAERFGFGQPTGMDVPGEAAGHVPRPPRADSILLTAATADGDSSGSRTSGPWYPGDALGLAIGQSRLTVTPLQIARLMAAIANGGWLVTPHVVRGFGPRLSDDDAGPAASLPRPEPQRIEGLDESTLTRVREGLERVVAHPGGTGYKHVRLEEVAIAGKTGTAEVGAGREDHAWFAGYVPADRPRIAFAVVLEHGGSGGAVAGTLAREAVRVMLDLRLIE